MIKFSNNKIISAVQQWIDFGRKLFIKKLIHQEAGFTLVEMLLAVAIFSVASVVVAAAFLNAISLEQQTSNYQKLQNDGRYIVEKIAKEVRGREIIPVYPSQNPTSTIDFYPDEFDSIVSIFYDSVNEDILYAQDGFIDNLNSPDVAVKALKIYTFPTKDPFSHIPLEHIQPRMTIYLKLMNREDSKYTKELILQTTISSKFYKR